MMTLHSDAFFRFSWALCPTAVMLHTLSAVIELQRNDSVFPQGSIKFHLALYDLIAAVVTWLVPHTQTHSLNGLWCCLFEHGGVTCLSLVPPPSPTGSRGHLTPRAEGGGIRHMYASPRHRRYSYMFYNSLFLSFVISVSAHAHECINKDPMLSSFWRVVS